MLRQPPNPISPLFYHSSSVPNFPLISTSYQAVHNAFPRLCRTCPRGSSSHTRISAARNSRLRRGRRLRRDQQQRHILHELPLRHQALAEKGDNGFYPVPLTYDIKAGFTCIFYLQVRSGPGEAIRSTSSSKVIGLSLRFL